MIEMLKTRRWLEKNKNKRHTPAFYSRPSGLDAHKREFLFDKIRKHLDSLPVRMGDFIKNECVIF